MEQTPRNTRHSTTYIVQKEQDEEAFYKSGHLFEATPNSLAERLVPLLHQHTNAHDIQSKKVYVENRAGTPEGIQFMKDIEHVIHTFRPFLQKWGTVPKDFSEIGQQALHDMQQPDFTSTVIHTAWGIKSASPKKNLYQ